MQNLDNPVFFANNIIVLAREYNSFIYPLDNTYWYIIFVVLFPSCYIFAKKQKEVRILFFNNIL
jgi:hypothetical protein